MRSACTVRAAAALPSATASWTESTWSKALSPRRLAVSAAILPAQAQLVDAVRSYAPGFIFTTALPPAVCAAATAAIRHLKASNWERERHQERAARTKAVLTAAALPVMTSPTHIVPVFVGDPERCKQASDLLLGEHGIYIQPINYPTVPKGKERLRITPSPYHDDGLIDTLAEALVDVWQRLGLPFKQRASRPSESPALAAACHGPEHPAPFWLSAAPRQRSKVTTKNRARFE